MVLSQSLEPVTLTSLLIAWWQPGDLCLGRRCRWSDLDPCHWPDSTLCVRISSLYVCSASLESEDQSKENPGEEETAKSPLEKGGIRSKRKWQAAMNLGWRAHHTWKRERSHWNRLGMYHKSTFCPPRGSWSSLHLARWWQGRWAWVSLLVYFLDM